MMNTNAPIIRLFNAKFSPNLGDGLLSECLEGALIKLGAHRETRSIDLAGRRNYGDEMKGRELILSALDRMPRLARQNLVSFPLAFKAVSSWRPHYSAGLEESDAVVLGGGNLISDIDLNFPTKLSLAIEEAERKGLPVVVYATGVSSDWSERGERMLKNAFKSPSVKGVFVRDKDSKHRWDTVLGDATGHRARIVRDPGLLAKDIYGVPTISEEERSKRSRPIVGLNVMSCSAIRYHCENAPQAGYLEKWYLDIAREFINRGNHVKVFTNGSPEDRAYLSSMQPDFSTLGNSSQISFPSAKNPYELCTLISELDVLVAYRMHAIIAAYAFGVPAVALAWDSKLSSFMSSVDRLHWYRDVTKITASECAELATEAKNNPVPEAKRLRVVREAEEGVAQLYSLLQSVLIDGRDEHSFHAG